MIIRTVLLILSLSSSFAFAQNAVKMTSNFGSENKEIQDIMDFEKIYIEKLNFEGLLLKGKCYEIRLHEFVNGKPVDESTLFDGAESDYFKIKTAKESLKFFFKLNDRKLKTYVRGTQFGSKRSYFTLNEDSDKYAVKDFFGSKNVLDLDINAKEEIPIFAIITPTIHKDGSGSYCEVVQSEIKPEKLGEQFKIPHYFLITIIFK